MCLVIIFIIAVIMYRVLMMIILYRDTDGLLRSQSSTVASLTASVLNLIIILALSKIYEKLALKLTQWG
jgi:anoctamin-7